MYLDVMSDELVEAYQALRNEDRKLISELATLDVLEQTEPYDSEGLGEVYKLVRNAPGFWPLVVRRLLATLHVRGMF